MIGKTVSHYRIEKRIGGGAMGEVYRARDARLGRSVALELLAPTCIRDNAAKKRFTREARSAPALQHHNICTRARSSRTRGCAPSSPTNAFRVFNAWCGT